MQYYKVREKIDMSHKVHAEICFLHFVVRSSPKNTKNGVIDMYTTLIFRLHQHFYFNFVYKTKIGYSTLFSILKTEICELCDICHSTNFI